ncbi:MAG: HlyD family secretion protein [Pseudomonadota bacterium]|uniref:HlyD family secretion protein n=1 Tax=Thermithiobacillus tepidarius TaxID=929 RepID=UPI0004158EED|nr:HlyD family secretion protein [Thermithiobacillus tepidarius]
MPETEAHPEARQRRLRAALVPLGRSRRGRVWLTAMAALLLLAWAGAWLYHRVTHVGTDDARVDGDVIVLSSRVAGQLTDLDIIEGDRIRRGQILARVDEREARLQVAALEAKLQATLAQAELVRAQKGMTGQETQGQYESQASRLSAAEATLAELAPQLRQSQADYLRARELATQKMIPQQDMEHARTAYEQVQQAYRKAEAELHAARGTLSAAGGSRRQVQVLDRQQAVLQHQADEIRAELQRQRVNLQEHTIRSPVDGVAVMTFVQRGEHVSPGQRIAMVLDPRNIWVEANVKETQIAKLRVGQPVDIHVDAYPDRRFRGTVYRIGHAATSQFALLPDPNPSGTFTKITQRLPVRILVQQANGLLRPGMMVEVDIDIRQH